MPFIRIGTHLIHAIPRSGTEMHEKNDDKGELVWHKCPEERKEAHEPNHPLFDEQFGVGRCNSVFERISR
jgi:hypothetical protein